MKDSADSILVPLLILASVLSGVMIGAYLANSLWRKDAVKHGKAEYGITQDGTPLWRWKP